MSANFTPDMGDYTNLRPFRFWCQKVLPLVYDNSLSYYELLCKVIQYLNMTMEDVQTLEGDVQGLHDAYVKLQDYVNHYFDNLDVQEEINNKLDEMVKDGTILSLFTSTLVPFAFVEWYGAIGDGVTNDTSAIQKAINDCSNRGAILFLDKKTYLVNELIAKNGLYLSGTDELNSVLYFESGSFIGDSNNQYLFNGQISNLTIKGNINASNQDGFYFSLINGNLRNCHAKYFNGTGFNILRYRDGYQSIVNEHENNYLDHCNATNCTIGFQLLLYDGLYNNLISGQCKTGIIMSGGYASNIHIWGYTRGGLDCYGATINNLQIEGCLSPNPNFVISLRENGEFNFSNVTLWNNNVNTFYIYCNNVNKLNINNLNIGDAGTLNSDSADKTKLQLISGSINNIFMTGIIDDSFTNGSIHNSLIINDNSFFNLLAKNMNTNNTADYKNIMYKSNINGNLTTGHNGSFVTETIVDNENLSRFIMGSFLGDGNTIHHFYGMISYNDALIKSDENVEAEMSNGKFTLTVNNIGIYKISCLCLNEFKLN